MPGNVRARWISLRSVLRRDEFTRRVSAADAVRDAFAWYGLRRRRILRALVTSAGSEALLEVDAGPYRISWPRSAPLGRLGTALVELWVPSNPHYYFRDPTSVRAGDHIIDVGACEGGFALECLLRHGAARVWCFEPGQLMAQALRTTAAANHVTQRMQVVEAAVGERSGSCTFDDDPTDPLTSRVMGERGAANGRPVTQVMQYALDDWVAQHNVTRVDYVKVDAEGSDLDVMRGAREILARWRPRIAATTYHDPEHCNEMIALIESLRLGYTFHVSGVVSFGDVARPVMLHAAVPGGHE
jgi:FkbM family methyltransferase